MRGSPGPGRGPPDCTVWARSAPIAPSRPDRGPTQSGPVNCTKLASPSFAIDTVAIRILRKTGVGRGCTTGRSGPDRAPIAPSGPDCTSGPDRALIVPSAPIGPRLRRRAPIGARLSRALSIVPSWHRLVLL